MKKLLQKTIFILVLSFQLLSSANGVLSDDAELWQYKKWTKVNSSPMRIADITAQLCAPQFPIDLSKEKNPHQDKFITVYVNDLGKAAMFSVNNKFPVGAIIVKEKLPTPTSKAELLTVMIKRKAGFNPASGDWEYLVLDPAKTAILERGKLERCNNCHLEKKDSDFVFRTYYFRK